jgi:crotonobetainyl-CoA:carnitine CoA-transferase CaiB-like acyl-CoA transferase
MKANSEGILAGVRVLDLAVGRAGSAAALNLSEAGAEVVKIEPPGGQADRDEPPWCVLNRGKKNVVLDLQASAGLEQMQAHLAAADVLIHDLTPAEAHARGLGDEELLRRYPMLVVAAVRAWPQRHPSADEPVEELLVLARLGVLDEQPGHRDGPIFIRMPFASWIAAWLCTVGIMARLLARDRDGRGGLAHTSLAQAALVPMAMHWSRAQHPTPAFAKGLDKTIPIPLHQCADGRWLHVHYSPDAAPWMADALAAMGPHAVAAANARFAPSHVAPNFGANRAIMATRSADDWVRHFWAHDVSAQIAAPFGEIHHDEQARLNGYVVEVEDARHGRTLQPGIAYRVEPPGRVGGPLHALGSDSGDAPQQPGHVLAGAGELRQGSALPPLQGLKVLDLGAYLAGPFACMVLADLGAEVIKVEPPSGDAMRRLERTFAGAQRGKRALALKLGDPAAQPVLDALVDWADVVHHNVRLPAARKLGIDAERLRANRPALVCCHISAYGSLGPRADWPGFDQLMQASCGWEVECGGVGNPPIWLRFGVGDHLAALSSVFAVLLALYRRARTGQGQSVSSSLLGAMLMTASEALGRPDGGATAIDHLDAAQTGLSAAHRLYRCEDAWIAVAARSPDHVAAFTRIAGPDFERFFREHPLADALAALKLETVPAAPALQQQLQAFLDDPANSAAGLHACYDHAVYGPMQQVGAFWDFGDLPLSLDRAPPALGQHSAEVLAMLGFDPTRIEQLQAQGITTLMPRKVAA